MAYYSQTTFVINCGVFVIAMMVVLTAFAPRATEKMSAFAVYLVGTLLLLVIYYATRYIVGRVRKVEKKLDRLLAAGEPRQGDDQQSHP